MMSKLKLAFLLSMMFVASTQHYVMASTPERDLGDKVTSDSTETEETNVKSAEATTDEVVVLSRATAVSEITRTRRSTTSSSKGSKSSKGGRRSKRSKCGKGSKSGKGSSKGRGYSKGYYSKGYYNYGHKGGKGSKGGKSGKGSYRYYRGGYDCDGRFDRRSRGRSDISVKSGDALDDQRKKTRSSAESRSGARAMSFTAATAGLVIVAVVVRKKLMNKDGGDKTHPLTGVVSNSIGGYVGGRTSRKFDI